LLVYTNIPYELFPKGWVGFGVPDWHEFQHFNGSTTEYYGLWAYCQDQAPFFVAVCKRWPDAQDQLFNGTRPSFVRTAEGLMTTGMIFLSLAIIVAIVAAVLPRLIFLAGALISIAFVFLIIGLPIFGRESDNLSKLRLDASYSKRYGFWLFVPTIILAFLAAIIFLVTGFLYQRFGFGNLASNSHNGRNFGGSRSRGPPNFLRGMPYGNIPGMYTGVRPNQYPVIPNLRQTSLLSQYIAQRIPRYYGPIVVRQPIGIGQLQPSIRQAVYQRAAPSYYRAPIINLTGQSLVGPAVRRA
jgi:hypothetical protein